MNMPKVASQPPIKYGVSQLSESTLAAIPVEASVVIDTITRGLDRGFDWTFLLIRTVPVKNEIDGGENNYTRRA